MKTDCTLIQADSPPLTLGQDSPRLSLWLYMEKHAARKMFAVLLFDSWSCLGFLGLWATVASKSTFDNLTSQLEASGNNSPVGEVEAF